MDIHFVSTLTPEDEARYAPMVIAAVEAVLRHVPISYALRLTTGGSRVFHHTKAEAGHGDAPLGTPLVHLTADAIGGPVLS